MLNSSLRSHTFIAETIVTLHEFIVEQVTLHTKFAEFWQKNASQDIEAFAMTLEPHQWDEQFELFRITEGFKEGMKRCGR